MDNVRVRFAPSPSGFLHIGGARTALFNYLFAKKRGGKFIIRIDDTDVSRSSDDSIKSILSDLKWLGLDWDYGPDAATLIDYGPDGPYRASLRKDIYINHANILLAKGLAYKDDTGAIRFRSTDHSNLTLFDDIRGKVSVPANSIKDFVIIRTNGMATYNFATVIDDHLMSISHVYRADEHLPNTFKHLLLFQAFGWSIPKFGHMSLIFGSDRAKLSKRHGAASIDDFRKKGYLAPALINFMSLLGWGHPKGKDIFDMKDLMDNFSIKKINIAPAVFDNDKLDWMNGNYLNRLSDHDLVIKLTPFLSDLNIDFDKTLKAVPVFKSHWKKLSDARKDFISLTDSSVPLTKDAVDFISGNDNFLFIKDYIKNNLDTNFIADLKSKGFNNKDIMWSIRILLLGDVHGPAVDLLLPLISRDILMKRVI